MYTRRRQPGLARGTAIVLVLVGGALATDASTAAFGWAAVMAGLALAGAGFQHTDVTQRPETSLPGLWRDEH